MRTDPENAENANNLLASALAAAGRLVLVRPGGILQ
jgi:hypothetical protein